MVNTPYIKTFAGSLLSSNLRDLKIMTRITVPISAAIHTAALNAGIGPVYVYKDNGDSWVSEIVQHHVELSGIQYFSAQDDIAGMLAEIPGSAERIMIMLENTNLFRLCDMLLKNGFRDLQKGMIVIVVEDFMQYDDYYINDTRHFGRILRIPILEPATYQEIVDAVGWGTNISEMAGLPVMIRLSKNMFGERARVFYNHSHADIGIQGYATTRNVSPKFPDAQGIMQQLSSQSDMNRFVVGSNRRLGVLACGVAFPLVMEIKDKLDLEFPVLKVGQYPLPGKLMQKLFAECREILILEEGEPVCEDWIRGYFDQEQVKGRLDATLPRLGVLTSQIIVKSLLG